MVMYNNDMKIEVHDMFEELREKATEIAETSNTFKIASQRITNIVSSRVAAESEGYIIDMYTLLVDMIKEDDYFKDPVQLNSFYRLNLRNDLNKKYNFEVKSLDTYKKGIEFTEINNLYVTASAAAITLTVGGVLKYAISGLINIPFVLIIAGAVAVACATYAKIVPNRNKRKFQLVIKKFLNNMENEILDWLVEVESYFNSRVRTLYSKNA